VSARRFQVLVLDVELTSAAPELMDVAQFLVQHARQPVATQRRVAVAIDRRERGYAVSIDGVAIDQAPTPQAVLQTVFAALQGRLLGSFPDHALVRGAVVSIGPVRTLLIGEPGCGLSSLAVKALYARHRVEGDAFALLGPEGVTPLPRRFVLREGTARLLPEVELHRLPTTPSGDGVISGLDPTEVGFDWEIGSGAIDACVWVEANHGAPSRLTTCSHIEIVRRLMSRCSRPPAGGRDWLQHAVRMTAKAHSLRLQLGRLDEAVAHLERDL
jgi:hypothetical protein